MLLVEEANVVVDIISANIGKRFFEKLNIWYPYYLYVCNSYKNMKKMSINKIYKIAFIELLK